MTSEQGQHQSVAEALGRISDAVFALDEEWQFTYCNEAAADFFGVSSETLTGQVVWEHVSEGRSSKFADAAERSMSSGEAQAVEGLFESPSRHRGHLYPSASGLTVHLEAAGDEEGDDQTLARQERVLEMMGDGVYAVDEAGTFTMVNDAYTEMVGYSREELLGEPATKVVDEEARRQAVALEEELQEDDRDTATMETTIQPPDGDPIVAEATFSKMSLPDGAQERVGVVRDITERKQREEQIEEHRDMLADHADRTELVQRIDRAITGATTRTEIYEAVCETLADSRFYQVAWIGDRQDRDLRLVAGAGTTDEGLDALVDAAQAEGELGPVERALQRRSIQVQQHIEDDRDDPRYDVFAQRDYHSSITLPLVHEGTVFGALTVDSKRAHAFAGSERDLLGTLADTVAFALQTVEARQRYQSVVEDVIDSTLDAGVVVYGDDGRVQWVNDRAGSFLDCDREGLLDQDARSVRTEVLAPALVEEPGDTVDQWLAETTGEPPVYHLGGEAVTTERYLERRCSTIESGLYAGGTVALYYDITDRQRSEQRLAESERRRRTLLENLPGMAYRCQNEAGWPMEFVSQGCAELTGYDPSRLEAGDLSWGESVVHPDDREDVFESIQTAVEAGEPFETTYRIVTADDETRWVWEQGRQVTTVDGRRLLEGFVTDVTERHRQREELRHQHEFNRQLLETTPVPILAFEPDGSLAHANAPAIESLDLASGDDGAGATYSVGELAVYDERGELISDEQRPVYRTLEAGETVTDEVVQIERADGERRWISFQSAPVFDEDGEVELAIAVCDDITELKAQQAELARLDHINSVIRQLNRSLVESSDQATVRRTVCRELAGAGPYGAAWYCEADLATDELTPAASAGLTTPADDVSFVVDESLAGEALTSGGVVVDELPPDHPFADAASRDGWTGTPTVAAVPISYGDTHYGVLCLAAGDRSAFSGEIRTVFAELGETIGHALTAIVRKEGLVGDAAMRLQFRLRDYFDADAFGVDPGDLSFQFDEIITVGDGTILQYVTVTGGSASAVADIIEADDEAIDYRRLDDGDGEELRFEIKQPEQPLFDAVTEFGGRIVSATIEDEDFSLVTEVPTSVEVRSVVERVQAVHPATDLEAQRSVSTPDHRPGERTDRLEDRLTDRQQTVLETAYFSGYFEWPRATTGEEIAASLDLAPSTLSQHLRMGEHKTFELLFDDDR